MAAVIGERSQGVNVAGYLRTESGVGEWARLVVEALDVGAVPHATFVYDRTVLRQHHDFAGRDGWGDYDITVIGVNADQLPFFVDDVGRDALEGRWRVGLWAWEVEDFPASMAANAAHLDVIWALSDHAAGAISRRVDVPVRNVPCPVRLPSAVAGTRQSVGFPDDAFVFLYAFDFYSVFERKNPLGAVEAFRRAFPMSRSADVHLVLKSINGAAHPAELRRLQEAAFRDPRIHVLDGYVDSAVQHDMLGLCDAYVSLHRAEGFGFTMAEAMSRGKPVIATGYSGNLEFMDDTNSFLVPFRRQLVGPGNDPYPADCPWADPDLDSAAALMREVVDGGAEVERRAAAAAATVAQRHTPSARAALIKEELEWVRSSVPRSPIAGQPIAVVSPAAAADREVLRRGLVLTRDLVRRPRTTMKRGARWLLRQLDEPGDHPPVDVGPAAVELDSLDERSADLALRLADAELELHGVRAALDSIRAAMRDVAIAEDVDREFQHLWELVDAVPYTSDPSALRVRDVDGNIRVGFDRDLGRADLGFSALFRGPEPFIRSRLRAYLPLLAERGPVLDFGCGRGELLDLLREQGTAAAGVDLDPEMVEVAAAKGLSVSLGDGLDVLRSVGDASLGAVFSSQVIEHLSHDDLLALLDLSRAKLRAGGVFIAETVNVHSLRAFKTFWLDPTHVRPLYPEPLLVWVAGAGFARAEIMFPNGTGQFDRDRRWEGEYAIVAWV